jgi:hypothetical protein
MAAFSQDSAEPLLQRGQAILNLYPLANVAGRNDFNYTSLFRRSIPGAKISCG